METWRKGGTIQLLYRKPEVLLPQPQALPNLKNGYEGRPSMAHPEVQRRLVKKI